MKKTIFLTSKSVNETWNMRHTWYGSLKLISILEYSLDDEGWIQETHEEEYMN